MSLLHEGNIGCSIIGGNPGREQTGFTERTQFEREILRERVRAGIAQALKEGRPHGRPRTASLKAAEVARLKSERVSHSGDRTAAGDRPDFGEADSGCGLMAATGQRGLMGKRGRD